MEINQIKNAEIKLVGVSARTSNATEANPATALIGQTMQKFFFIQQNILNRINPGRVFSVYTDYENQADGEYTYFVGEEVSEFSQINTDLSTLTIPEQKYTKFTTDQGPIPRIVFETWQHIWGMNDLQRAFVADFEIYDERSNEMNSAIVDIYIGVK